MCTREMVEWQRRRLLDSSCECVLALRTIVSPQRDLYVLTTADEQLSVVDNRLTPDLLADSFWQLGDAFLSAPQDSLAIFQDYVNLGDIDPISLQRRPKIQSCLCTTDESWKLLRAGHQDNVLLFRVVRTVTREIVVECLATAKCRHRLHLPEVGICWWVGC